VSCRGCGGRNGSSRELGLDASHVGLKSRHAGVDSGHRCRDVGLDDAEDASNRYCPRKQARNMNDQCGARCPDLPKVV
jgi:hypothetical protein